MTQALLRPTVVILTKDMPLARSLLVTLSDIEVECEATFDNPRHVLLHTTNRALDACLVTPSHFARDELREIVPRMQNAGTKVIAILRHRPQNERDVEPFSRWILASNDMYEDLERVLGTHNI